MTRPALTRAALAAAGLLAFVGLALAGNQTFGNLQFDLGATGFKVAWVSTSSGGNAIHFRDTTDATTTIIAQDLLAPGGQRLLLHGTRMESGETVAALVTDQALLVNTAGGVSTVTLPDASDYGPRLLTIVKHDAGSGLLRIVPAGSDTIHGDGIVPSTRDPYGGFRLLSDGVDDWHPTTFVRFSEPAIIQEGSLVAATGGMDQHGFLDGSTITANANNYGLGGEGLYRNLVSGSGNGAEAGLRTTANVTRVDAVPRLDAKFRAVSTTDVRYFLGLADAGLSTMVSSDSPAAAYVGLSYSTTRGDTNWQAVASAGVTQTVTDTGVAYTSAVRFVEVIVLSVTEPRIEVSLLDSDHEELACVEFTNVPSATTGLRPVMGLEKTAAGGSGKELDVYVVHLEAR